MLNVDFSKGLERLPQAITLVAFTQRINCPSCPQLEHLLSELKNTGKVNVLQLNPVLDSELADSLGKIFGLPFTNVPATLILQGKADENLIKSANGFENQSRVAFFGLPAGYELQTLAALMIAVSSGQVELSQQTKRILDELRLKLNASNLWLQLLVFVTPTCPYCPVMAINAGYFAIYARPVIATAIINASEFPNLAGKYAVVAVPKTVVTVMDKTKQVKSQFIEGAIAEEAFAQMLLDMLKSTSAH